MGTKLKPIFTGTIENGELKLHNRKQFVEYIRNMKGEVELVIYRKRKNRTLKQNSYYWLCMEFLAEELGEDPNELHSTFKAMFLVDRSKKLPIVKSTTTLNSLEMTEYIEKIRRAMANLGIKMPNPEDLCDQ